MEDHFTYDIVQHIALRAICDNILRLHDPPPIYKLVYPIDIVPTGTQYHRYDTEKCISTTAVRGNKANSTSYRRARNTLIGSLVMNLHLHCAHGYTLALSFVNLYSRESTSGSGASFTTFFLLKCHPPRILPIDIWYSLLYFHRQLLLISTFPCHIDDIAFPRGQYQSRILN